MSVAEMRTRARLGKFAVEHAHSLEDDELPPLSIRVVRVEDQEDLIEFEVIGIDPPIANAFRRIMIAEVPSMAIEHVNLYQNTSIIQDEVLVHRLGLIPINADPRKFKFLQEIEGRHTSETTLVFTLHVSCEEGKNPPSVLADARGREVWSKDLKWIPQGPQRKIFKSNPVAPIHDDILIARLRPGQEIEAELFVEKGIGREHAKWSPVCTASYRLMPDIQLLKKVEGEEAVDLVKSCAMGVFDIEDGAAVVKSPRSCTSCRECIRKPGNEEFVKVMKIKHHFIYTVESVGMYPAQDIFIESVKILKSKCAVLLEELEKLNTSKEGEQEPDEAQMDESS